MKKYEFDVDFVITWVDGADREWLKEKNKYLDKEHQVDIDAGANRYRDWDNLQYLFRGIEKFAPWVRKVFFITCGQKPKWLNINNDKLVLVKHEDYMPAEYLPTFSSRPIELNMHRIKDLSEHFVYFNDDFFLTKPVKKSDFFDKNGLPKIVAMEKPKSIADFVYDNMTMNNVRTLNKKFDKRTVKDSNRRKWYNLRNPVCYIMNKFYDKTAKVGWAGFYIDHLPVPFLKSGMIECWEQFYDELDTTSRNKFKSVYDINQYLFTEYLLCTGKFFSDKYKRKGQQFQLDDGEKSNIDFACKCVIKQKYKMTCLNDAKVTNFEETKGKINKALNDVFPEKSSFEL